MMVQSKILSFRGRGRYERAAKLLPTMGRKTNLKAMLTHHQDRQRKAQLQNAREAARKDALKKSTGKGNPSAKSKGKRPAQSRSSTIPLTASDTILLVGEGNFSFTRALFTSGLASLEFLPPVNVTATAYDSEECCYAKYPDAQEIVKELRERGVTVLFNVDARRLDACKELKKKKWQRVVWNFPHAGRLSIYVLVMHLSNWCCVRQGYIRPRPQRSIESTAHSRLSQVRSSSP